MSKVLVLRMAGPMQSWGSSSRFTRRSTEAFPTKSGILGLLAAAQGRRRTDPIEDLAQLRVAVRVDQRGELLRDFHTAHRGSESMPLSERYYRADAAFAGFVEGPNKLIDGLSQAILRPVFPLCLGRRSCPPTMPLRLAVRDEEMWEVITTTPWLASKYYQKKQRFEQSVSLRVLADKGVIPEDVGATLAQTLQDVPVSFDSEHRMYTFRTVEETRITLENPEYVSDSPQEDTRLGHDPMGVL